MVVVVVVVVDPSPFNLSDKFYDSNWSYLMRGAGKTTNAASTWGLYFPPKSTTNDDNNHDDDNVNSNTDISYIINIMAPV